MSLDLATVHRARTAFPGWIRRTPLLPISASEEAPMLYVKAENLQVTGAYKPRAAASVVASMAPEHLKNGIALASSGNFAQAFALLGRLARIPVVVVMLDRTSQYKVDAAAQTRSRGGVLRLGRTCEAANS